MSSDFIGRLGGGSVRGCRRAEEWDISRMSTRTQPYLAVHSAVHSRALGFPFHVQQPSSDGTFCVEV